MATQSPRPKRYVKFTTLQDERVKKLIEKAGWSVYGIYCAIVELMMSYAEAALPKNYEYIAQEIGANTEQVKRCIEWSGLFETLHDEQIVVWKKIKHKKSNNKYKHSQREQKNKQNDEEDEQKTLFEHENTESDNIRVQYREERHTQNQNAIQSEKQYPLNTENWEKTSINYNDNAEKVYTINCNKWEENAPQNSKNAGEYATTPNEGNENAPKYAQSVDYSQASHQGYLENTESWGQREKERMALEGVHTDRQNPPRPVEKQLAQMVGGLATLSIRQAPSEEILAQKIGESAPYLKANHSTKQELEKAQKIGESAPYLNANHSTKQELEKAQKIGGNTPYLKANHGTKQELEKAQKIGESTPYLNANHSTKQELEKAQKISESMPYLKANHGTKQELEKAQKGVTFGEKTNETQYQQAKGNAQKGKTSFEAYQNHKDCLNTGQRQVEKIEQELAQLEGLAQTLAQTLSEEQIQAYYEELTGQKTQSGKQALATELHKLGVPTHQSLTALAQKTGLQKSAQSLNEKGKFDAYTTAQKGQNVSYQVSEETKERYQDLSTDEDGKKYAAYTTAEKGQTAQIQDTQTPYQVSEETKERYQDLSADEDGKKYDAWCKENLQKMGIEEQVGQMAKQSPYSRIPTLEEVKAYIRARGFGIEAEEFFYFYEANGWRIGKNPVTKWKAVVNMWENRRVKEANQTAQKAQNVSSNYTNGYKKHKSPAQVREDMRVQQMTINDQWKHISIPRG